MMMLRSSKKASAAPQLQQLLQRAGGACFFGGTGGSSSGATGTASFSSISPEAEVSENLSRAAGLKPANEQEFSIYRWSPETPGKPVMQKYKARKSWWLHCAPFITVLICDGAAVLRR